MCGPIFSVVGWGAANVGGLRLSLVLGGEAEGKEDEIGGDALHEGSVLLTHGIRGTL